MADAASGATLLHAGAPASAPYAPSMLDRVIAWVDRLPGPAFPYYFAAWAALAAIDTGLKWLDGTYPMGRIRALDVALPGLGIFAIAALRRLGQVAKSQLALYRPALTASDAEYDDTEYRLTVLPARIALVTLIATILIVPLYGTAFRWYFVNYGIVQSSSPASWLSNFAIQLLIIWSVLCLCCQIYRQLTLLRLLIATRTLINLYQVDAHYAFSKLTALAALIIIVPTYLWVAAIWLTTAGDDPTLQMNIWSAAANTFAGIFVFVWPLFGLHTLLEAEKARQLAETSKSIEQVSAELRRRVSASEMTGMDQLKATMDGLVAAKNDLLNTSTWPWQRDTARWLLTVLLLPVLLWITQRLLEKLLGF